MQKRRDNKTRSLTVRPVQSLAKVLLSKATKDKTNEILRTMTRSNSILFRAA